MATLQALFHRQLFAQSLPVLMTGGLGLVLAGVIFSHVAESDVFQRHSNLTVMVPVLLGLKCCLELTLASRLSTAFHSANLDADLEIDLSSKSRLHPQQQQQGRGPVTKNKAPKFHRGTNVARANLGVMQVQALVVGVSACLFALLFATLLRSRAPEWDEAFLLLGTSVTTTFVVALLLGSFTVFLIEKSIETGADPDNVSGPLVTSIGDVVAILLVYVTSSLFLIAGWLWSLIVAFLIFSTAPYFLRRAKQHHATYLVLVNGWRPIIANLTLSTLAGIFLGAEAEHLSGGLAVLLPLINGMGGNISGIYSSRLSTALHKGRCKPGEHVRATATLVLSSLVVQACFLAAVVLLHEGDKISAPFVAAYLTCVALQGCALLNMSQFLAKKAWAEDLDPDNHVIPYLNAASDFSGTLTIVVLSKIF